MVLNLLERHSLDQAKDLIERSFGQFRINQQLEPLYEQKLAWEAELDRLQRPLCPDKIGDLPLYAKRLDAIKTRHKQLKLMERSLRNGEGKAELQGVHGEITNMLAEAYDMPCHGCPVQKPCSKQSDRVRQLERRIKEFDRRIENESNKYWRTFEALANILRTKGYLDSSKPTKLGRLAIGIRGTNELFLSEVALSGVLTRLKPHQFAAVLTALVTEQGRQQENMRLRVSPEVDLVLDEINHIGRSLFRLQRDFDVEIPIEFSPVFSPLTELWAQHASWDDMRLASLFDEGDIVRSLRRTVDLCRQFSRAPGMPEPVVELALATEPLIARDEVKDDF
jgi:superfamily II RNA helicase